MTTLHPNVRYQLNETFFNVIDTEEKAYILGFIMADGCVTKTGHKVVINLKSTDAAILEAIKEKMQYSGPLRYYPAKISRKHHGKNIRSSESVTLCISRKQIAEDLRKHGVYPAKSLTLGFPDRRLMGKHLWRHFLRGYFDGDGTVHVSSTSCCLRWGVVGTEDFCSGIGELLDENGIHHNAVIKIQDNGLHDIRVGSHYNLKRLWIFLYDGATIWLERKRAIMDAYFMMPHHGGCRAKTGFPGVIHMEKRYIASFRNRFLGSARTPEEAYKIREIEEEKQATEGLWF